MHLDQQRVEMRQVKVVRTSDGDRNTVHLIGTVKTQTEAVASAENLNIVFKTKTRQEREAIIRLIARPYEGGEILAFESGNLLGFVIWDTHTNARKLPVFIRRLLGATP